MSESAANRRSFRIEESVYLRYRVISEEEFDGGLERYRIRSGSSEGMRSKLVDLEARIDESLFLLKAQSGKVAGLLEMLNDKINLIAEQLPSLRETKTALASQEPQVCELSADGMVFGSSNAFAPETKLLLDLLLEADNRYIETFCRVVRLTDAPSSVDPTHAHGVAVEFVGMKPSEKELLIQHLFSRESETLRMRRLKLDAADD